MDEVFDGLGILFATSVRVRCCACKYEVKVGSENMPLTPENLRWVRQLLNGQGWTRKNITHRWRCKTCTHELRSKRNRKR